MKPDHLNLKNKHKLDSQAKDTTNAIVFQVDDDDCVPSVSDSFFSLKWILNSSCPRRGCLFRVKLRNS